MEYCYNWGLPKAIFVIIITPDASNRLQFQTNQEFQTQTLQSEFMESSDQFITEDSAMTILNSEPSITSSMSNIEQLRDFISSCIINTRSDNTKIYKMFNWNDEGIIVFLG